MTTSPEAFPGFAVDERREALSDLAFLAEAGSLLAVSLDADAVLRRIADLLVPSFADWCTIDMLGSDGRVQRITVRHADPNKAAIARSLEEHPPRIVTPDVAGSLRNGEGVLFETITPAQLVQAAGSEEELAALRALELRSAISVPMVARGRTLGVISLLSAESGRIYDKADLALAEDIARRAALAVDNARLFSNAQEAKHRYRTLVQNLDAIVWEADASPFRFTFVSTRAEEMLGYPMQRWLRETDFHQQIVHPEDRERVARFYAQIEDPGAQRSLDYRIIDAGQHTVWVRDSILVERTATGLEQKLRGLITDITERRREEEEDRARADALLAVTRVLAEADTLPEAGSMIIKAICENLGWKAGGVWPFDPSTGTLALASTWSDAIDIEPYERASRALRIKPGDGLVGRVFLERKPIWLEDAGAEPTFLRPEAVRGCGLRGACAFPILDGKDVMGVIEFFSTKTEQPDHDLLAMLESIGSQIGQFVIRRWAEEQTRFNKALLESQNDATIDGIVIVSPNGSILSFNRRFAEIFDVPADMAAARDHEQISQWVLAKMEHPDELVERGIYLHTHPEESDRQEIVLKDGRILDRYCAPLRGEHAEIFGRAWYYRDVTDGKNAEARLAENNKRFAFLAEATAILSASLDHTQTLQTLAELTVPQLADWCLIDILQEDGTLKQVALHHADPAMRAFASDEQARNPAVPARDAPRGVARVLRTGRSEMAEQIQDEWLVEAAGDAQYLEAARGLGFGSYMCVPLLARGRTLGVITFITAESGRRYTAADLTLAEDLARRAALAVDNARLYSEREHVARTLQDSLLPPTLPDIPGVDCGAVFQFAGAGTEVGGDFFDLFETGDDDWAIVVGDVCGKGADAAGLTALARYTIRAAAIQARKPSRVLGMLNEAILRQRSDGRFCTVAYARLGGSPGEPRRLTIATGGHPLPFILRADGRVETIGEPGMLLGVFPESLLNDQSTTLDHGDAVIMYTDGVTEARGTDGILGEHGLRALIAGCVGFDAAAIASAIARHAMEIQSGEPRDDIAVVVARVR